MRKKMKLNQEYKCQECGHTFVCTTIIGNLRALLNFVDPAPSI